MQPDLAFANVLACATGVTSVVFVVIHLFFPDLIRPPALRQAFCLSLLALAFLLPLTGWAPAWSRYYALGVFTGLFLAALGGIIALICYAHFTLRTAQLREYIAVHRRLTRHRRD